MIEVARVVAATVAILADSWLIRGILSTATTAFIGTIMFFTG